MPLIALTGGIASGKSTISSRLDELGAVVVDADVIVRDLQQPGSDVLEAILDEFGTDMLLPDGNLDRKALGERVFGDAEAVAALNRIVHPAVKVESELRFKAAFEKDPDAVVVYIIPLLVEARGNDEWDLTVVAHAPAEARKRRLIYLRGMSDAEAAARISSQTSDDARLAVADVVIDTAGTLDETMAQIDQLWAEIPKHIARKQAS